MDIYIPLVCSTLHSTMDDLQFRFACLDVAKLFSMMDLCCSYHNEMWFPLPQGSAYETLSRSGNQFAAICQNQWLYSSRTRVKILYLANECFRSISEFVQQVAQNVYSALKHGAAESKYDGRVTLSCCLPFLLCTSHCGL